jgi:hypothetical protein
MKIKTTYLEMLAPSQRVVPPPREGLAVVHAKKPTTAYYRFLYDDVGRDYDWTSRKKLSDAELAALMRSYKGCPVCGELLDYDPHHAVKVSRCREEFLYFYGGGLGRHLSASPDCKVKGDQVVYSNPTWYERMAREDPDFRETRDFLLGELAGLSETEQEAFLALPLEELQLRFQAWRRRPITESGRTGYESSECRVQDIASLTDRLRVRLGQSQEKLVKGWDLGDRPAAAHPVEEQSVRHE